MVVTFQICIVTIAQDSPLILTVFAAPFRIILSHAASPKHDVITLRLAKHLLAGIAVDDSSHVFRVAFWAAARFSLRIHVKNLRYELNV
jgi:hypothetical protein